MKSIGGVERPVFGYVPKEWGEERIIINDQALDLCGKRMVLKEGFQSSIHWHVKKTETFYVEKGRMKLEYWKRDGKKNIGLWMKELLWR
jgi:quercetin dioxygenase-like cupin family protein